MADFTSEGAGLVSAYATGAQIAQNQKMLQFEKLRQEREFGLQNRRLTVEEQNAQINQGKAAIDIINQQKQDTAQQLYFLHRNLSVDANGQPLAQPRAPTADEQAQFQTLTQRAAQLREAQQHAYRQTMGPMLTQTFNDRDALFDDLHSGKRTLDQVQPSEIGSAVAAATGRPASSFIDTPNGLSEVGQKLKGVRDGMAAAKDGKGTGQLLSSFNNLAGHELQSLVGQHAYDGSTITEAKFAAMTPNPQQPTNVVPVVQLTVQGPDGRVGTQYRPLMSEDGHFLAHPDETGQGGVRSANLDTLFNHFGALEQFYNVLNHPDMRDKVIDHALNDGNTSDQQIIQAMHALGTDPINFTPKSEVSLSGDRLLIKDEHGNFKVIAQPMTEKEQADAAHQRMQDKLTEREIKNMEAGLGRWGDAGAGGFSGDVGDLSAALAERGVTLPTGFRSKQQQLGLFQSLLSRHPDKTPDEIADLVKSGQIDMKAVGKMTQVAAGMAGKINTASYELEGLIPQIMEAAKAIPRTEFVPYNKLIQMEQGAMSDPKLARLRALLVTASNNYDVISGRGGTDAEKREHARKLFSEAQGNDALFAVLNTIVGEARIARQASHKAMSVQGAEPTAEDATAAPQGGALTGSATSPAGAQEFHYDKNGNRIP